MVTLNRNRVYSNFGFKGGIRFGIGNAKPTRKWNIFELAPAQKPPKPNSADLSTKKEIKDGR